MDIQIIAKQVTVSDTTRGLVHRRIGFALGRFESRIARVVVRFEDLNGPKGGIDQRCSIDVQMRPRGEVRAEVIDTTLESAVHRATERASRGIANQIEREQSRSRSPRSKLPQSP